jgi:hypothetical protein
MAWVLERTIPTERSPFVSEISANFSGERVPRDQRDGSLRPYSRISRQEPVLFYQAAPRLYSRGWVDPVPDPLLLSGSAGNRTRASGSALTPWPESASEPYRPRDCSLSEKLVPTFAERGCHVVSATNPYGLILGFLDRHRTPSMSLRLFKERDLPRCRELSIGDASGKGLHMNVEIPVTIRASDN